MSTIILEKIRKAEKDRQELVMNALSKEQMVRGTFCQIYVRCGRRSCWCVTGKGHPHKRMSWHEKGVSFSRAVPVEDREWIEKMTQYFREYRLIRRAIKKMDKKIDKLLDQQEAMVLKRTMKGRPYLDVWKSRAPKVDGRKSSGAPGKSRRKK